MFRCKLLVLLVGAACGTNQPRILLRYHPPPGAVYQYELVQRTTLVGGRWTDTVERVWKTYFTYVVRGPADDGGTLVEITIDSTHVRDPLASDSSLTEVRRLHGRKTALVFDDRARLIRSASTAQGLAAATVYRMEAVAQAAAMSFPEKAIAVGDSWTHATVLPSEAFGASTERRLELETRMTLHAIDILGRDTVAIFESTQQAPDDPMTYNNAGTAITVRTSGTTRGQRRFSLVRGTLVSDSTLGILTLTAKAPGSPDDSAVVHSRLKSTLRLRESQ